MIVICVNLNGQMDKCKLMMGAESAVRCRNQSPKPQADDTDPEERACALDQVTRHSGGRHFARNSDGETGRRSLCQPNILNDTTGKWPPEYTATLKKHSRAAAASILTFVFTKYTPKYAVFFKNFFTCGKRWCTTCVPMLW